MGSRRIEYEIIYVKHAELGKQLTELDGNAACRADENGLKPRQPRKLGQKIAHGDKQQNVDDDTLQRLGAGNMENRKSPRIISQRLPSRANAALAEENA